MGEDLKTAVSGPGPFPKEDSRDWPAWALAFSRSAHQILAALQESSQEENENWGDGENQTSNPGGPDHAPPTLSQVSSAWSRLELLVQERRQLLHAFQAFLKGRDKGEWAALGQPIFSEALALDRLLTEKLSAERDRHSAILADLAAVKVNLAHLAQSYGT